MTGSFFGPVFVYNQLIICDSIQSCRAASEPVDIKALPPAHRAIFQAQQTANDELRATVDLLTDTNRRLEHLIGRAAPGDLRQEVREAPA